MPSAAAPVIVYPSRTMEVIAAVPLYCSHCCARFDVRLDPASKSALYSHPNTECFLNDKRFRSVVGTHGQITVDEL